MKLPQPCGPVSRRVTDVLRADPPAPRGAVLGDEPMLADPDTQLGLWILYELAYRGFDDVDPSREWDPGVVGMRADIEHRFEGELREATRERLADVPDREDVGDQVLALAREDDGPRFSAYLRRDATADQMRDYLRERSVQQLKESDPQSFLLPRLIGAAKVALAELQYDEYGAGRPDRLHQTLYARALAAAGLDATYGAYVEEVSGISLASANVMSLFSFNRRLLGAALGHFAAFEASSSQPSRRVASGIERLELGDEVAAYFLEHVEADAVHEQVAARDVCGAYVADDPARRDDVLFGATCLLHLDALFAAELLGRWESPAANPTVGVAS
ncbi:MAG TPA: iron-containing redox enzyme family protein [Nocardioides sp.]|nr:iron-containing redox enzyme family protein [Nocardioides sp.]